MNAVEIEEAVSRLATQPFDTNTFPFDFLTAFRNKATTVKRLRGGSGNASDVPGGIDVVATYKLANINRTKLENVFHRVFAPAQLDLTIHDRFGHPVRPREWFLVPLKIVDEAVDRIRDGSIINHKYDPKTASLVLDR